MKRIQSSKSLLLGITFTLCAVLFQPATTALGASTADPTFATPIVTTYQGTFLGFGDINGDAKLDLVLVGDSTFIVRLADGHGGFSNPIITQLPSTLSEWPIPMSQLLTDFVIGDFNSDKKADIAFSPGFGDQIYVYAGTSAGVFKLLNTFVFSNGARVLNGFDLNSDGYEDLIMFNSSSYLTNTFYSMLGGPQGVGKAKVSSTFFNVNGFSCDVTAIGNVAANKKPGLVCTSSGGIGVVPIALGATAASVVPYALGVHSTEGDPAWVGDFNADSHADVLVRAGNGAYFGGPSNLVLMLNSASGLKSPQLLLDSNSSWLRDPSIDVGDFNGDGLSDIAILDRTSDPSDPNYQQIGILTNLGAGQFAPIVAYKIPSVSLTQSIHVADLNRDGVSDLFFVDSGSVTEMISTSPLLHVISTSKVTPTPTAVTGVSNANQIKTLLAQVKTLRAKLTDAIAKISKICNVKTKPKYCLNISADLNHL